MKKYAIWLIIEEEEIQNTIHALAETNKTPKFQAHITLLGGINGDEDFSVLDSFKNWKPQESSFYITLGEPACSSSYYQCVFYHIKMNIELLQLRVFLENQFQKKAAFFPHISLLYSQIDMEKRYSIMEQVPISNKTILVQQIALVEIHPTVEDWKIVALKRLGKPF